MIAYEPSDAISKKILKRYKVKFAHPITETFSESEEEKA